MQIVRDHECHRSMDCICSMSALEPADKCPQHGGGSWPPRCDLCQRYLPWSEAGEISKEVWDRLPKERARGPFVGPVTGACANTSSNQRSTAGLSEVLREQQSLTVVAPGEN